MNKFSYILLFISLFYSTEVDYLGEYNSTIIPDISIDLNELNFEYNEGFSLYIKFENENNVTWNKKLLEKKYLDDAYIQSNKPFLYDTKIIKDKYLSGTIKDYISNEFILRDNSKIIEIPINKSFNDDANLILLNLPILIDINNNFSSEIEIMYDQSYIYNDFNKYKWRKINHILIKSDMKVNLDKNYNFIKTKNIQKINFTLNNEGPSIFREGEHIKILVDENCKFNTLQNINNIEIITNIDSINQQDFDIEFEDQKIILIPRSNLINLQEVKLKNIQILVNNIGENSLSINLKVPKEIESISNNPIIRFFKSLYQKELNISENEIDFNFHSSDKKINIHELNLSLIDDQGDILFTNDRNIANIPPIKIKSNINLSDLGDLEFFIIDSVDIFLKNNKMQDKKIIYNTNQDLELIVNDLSLIDINNFNKKIFNLNYKFKNIDNIEKLDLPNKIVINNPNISLKNNVNVFSYEENITIGPFLIETVPNISNIMVDDILKIKLKNIKSIRINQFDKIKLSEYFEYSVKNETIILKCKKDIDTDELSFHINADKLLTKNKIYPSIIVIPGNYVNERKSYSVPQKKFIMVTDFYIDLERDISFPRLIKNNFFEYSFPELIINNAGKKSTDKITNIKISFPDINNYSFKIIDNNNSLSLLNNGTIIRYELNRIIEAKEKIKLNNFKIIFSDSTKDFQNSKLFVEVEGLDVEFYTKNNISFGDIDLVSTERQAIFENKLSSRVYSLVVDFSEIPQILNELKNIELILPNEVEVFWSSNRKPTIWSTSKKELKPRYNINAERKICEFNLEKLTKSSDLIKFTIADLYFDDIGNKSKEFNIEMKINGYNQVVSIDKNNKVIVERSNIVETAKNKINEIAYPFKKTNKIKIIIEDDYFVFDDFNIQNIYSKTSQIKAKAKTFSQPIFNDKKNEFELEIINDYESKIKGVKKLDFNQELKLDIPYKSLKKNTFLPSKKVKLIINSIYGSQKLENKDIFEESIEYNVKVNPKKGTITISLKLIIPEELNIALLQWYRYPYNPKTFYDGEQYKLLDRKSKEKRLQDLGNKLVLHANNLVNFRGHARIYDDWLFWYYLASYKMEVDKIDANKDDKWNLKFREYGQIDIDIYLKSCNDDIRTAEQGGWSNEVLKNPCEGNDIIPKEKYFDEIYSLFKNGKYYKANNKIIEHLYIKNNFKNVDHFDFFLLYIDYFINKCIYREDKNLRKNKSYTDKIYEKLDEILSNPIYNEKIEFYIQTKYQDGLFNTLKDNDYIGDCFDYNTLYSANEFATSEIYSQKQNTFYIEMKWVEDEWLRKDKMSIPEKYEWKVEWGELYENNKKNISYIDFNKQKLLDSKKSYYFNFNPNVEKRKRIFYSGITASTILFFSLIR
jgi:hypothetical protein